MFDVGEVILYAFGILVAVAFALIATSMLYSYFKYKDLTKYMLDVYNDTFNQITNPPITGGADSAGGSGSTSDTGKTGGAGDTGGSSSTGGTKPPEEKKPFDPSLANMDEFFEKEQTQSFKMMGIILGSTLAIQLGPKIAKYLGTKIAANRVAKSLGEKSIRLASGVLKKLGSKLSATALGKLGLRVSQAIAARVAGSLVAKGATKAATMAASAAMKASIVLAPIGLAMDAIAIVSLGLDMADVGGYMAMGTIEMYKAIRQDIWDNFKKTFTDEKLEFPIIFGPLDKLSEKDADRFAAEQDEIIKSITSDLNDPLMTKLKATIDNYLVDNPDKTPADLEKYIDENFDKLIDIDAIMNKATVQMCDKYRGKMVNNSCSYATPADCKSSMEWPPNEESKDTYVEWDPDTKTCNVASIGMYSICMDAKLGYDWNKRNCNITQDYCISKGAKWGYNADIGEYDCVIPKDQEVFEAIFGTTMTRGAIQIFSPDQYCPCPAGANEVPPYLCDVCPVDAPERIGALCYEKCPDGYVSSGFGCRKPCPTDGRFREEVLSCTKLNQTTPTYNVGTGRVPDASCDPGWSLRGVGAASWCDDGPKWDFWNLRTSKSNFSCNSGSDMIDGLCYDKCPVGYIRVPGMPYLCRKVCPDGTHYTGANNCYAECPSGFTDFGLGCSRPGFERDPKPLVTTTKKRRIELSKKDSAAITTGNC